MNAKTARALEDSIAHWRRMREDPDCRDTPYQDGCALCRLFNAIQCSVSCPVRAATGQGGCQDTPYSDAVSAWSRRRFYPLDDALAAWRAAADAEVAFLEGLRDE